MLDIIIAKCPRCGRECYGWTEEEALKKYDNHECMVDKSEEELGEILEAIIKDKRF